MRHRGTHLMISAFCCGLSVSLGALGAHLLGEQLDDKALHAFATANRYLFLHSLAGFALALASKDIWLLKLTPIVAVLWLIGSALFCGSLYLYAMTGTTSLMFLTPMGGLSYLLAWGLAMWLGFQVLQTDSESTSKGA